MGSALRLLIVDDSTDDAELLLSVLREGGFDPSHARVDTSEAMAHALATPAWDAVICDWNMPAFSALEALSIMKSSGLDLPFIIVSGTINEETAIEALRGGAHDFMSKERPVRLVTGVQRELKEAAVRRERRNMHEHLLLADRMASLGLMAAGVAHEINNPLTCVMASLDLALKDIDARVGQSLDPGRLRRRLRDAAEAAGRIRELARDLTTFSRGEADKPEAVDPRQALDFALRIASCQIRERARVIKDYGVVPLVMANESRLGQVFLNLIVNAAQAIDEGRPDENEIRIATRTDNQGCASVEIRDSGCGIPKEVLDKLFMPFVTTKPVGVGTGLGLSICNRIVTELGGHIAAESILDEGTTFRVTLPSAPA